MIAAAVINSIDRLFIIYFTRSLQSAGLVFLPCNAQKSITVLSSGGAGGLLLLLRGRRGRRRAAGTDHLLEELEAEPPDALVPGDGHVRELVVVPDVRRIGIAVLVRQELVPRRVGVSRPDVPGLQRLRGDVRAAGIAHFDRLRQLRTSFAVAYSTASVDVVEKSPFVLLSSVPLLPATAGS